MMPSTIISLDDRPPAFASRYARRSPAAMEKLRRRQELTLLPVGESFIAHHLSDAMTGENIIHLDQIHCERVGKVESGSLAIVNTPFGLMLRRYHVHPDYIRLEAANPHFPTLYLPFQDVHVIGRPYRLMRDLTPQNESEVTA